MTSITQMFSVVWLGIKHKSGFERVGISMNERFHAVRDLMKRMDNETCNMVGILDKDSPYCDRTGSGLSVSTARVHLNPNCTGFSFGQGLECLTVLPKDIGHNTFESESKI